MHTLALRGRDSLGVLPYPIVWIFTQLSLLWLISSASWPLYSLAYTGLNRIITSWKPLASVTQSHEPWRESGKSGGGTMQEIATPIKPAMGLASKTPVGSLKN